MLNFNLKKKYLSVLSNYSPKEIAPKKLSDLNLKIIDQIIKKDLSITIELYQEYDLDWNRTIAELTSGIETIGKLKKVNIIVTHHKSQPKPLKQNKKQFNHKLILVCSAKGGVGKSTICVNLALALKMLGKKTAIIDSDIYGPSTHHLLGISKAEPKVKDGIMMPYEKHGVKLNSMGLIVPEDKALIWRAPMLTKTLNNLLYSTDWGDTEYLFVDLPPGTGDVYLTLLKNHPNAEAILISTPQKISLIDVSRSIDLLKKLDIGILGIIENMAYKENGPMSEHVTNFAKERNIKHLGKILYDDNIAYYSDISEPAILQKKLNFSDELKKIAKLLMHNDNV